MHCSGGLFVKLDFEYIDDFGKKLILIGNNFFQAMIAVGCMGNIKAELGDMVFEVHFLCKQTIVGTAKAIVAIKQKPRINFHVHTSILWQKINWQSHEIVDTKLSQTSLHH